jgi:hypothetical protein
MLNLDGVTMFVSASAENGVVGSDTRLQFTQRGPRVAARYQGGAVARGWLIGRLAGSELAFHYVQRKAAGGLHCGHSVAFIERRHDGRLRMVEHFTWSSRPGSGTNVFDEVPPGA